jgi:hypothetical protein
VHSGRSRAALRPFAGGTDVEELERVGLLTLAMSLALTHASGVSGYSGKQGAICNQCHSGGGAPSVFLMGPQMLFTGQSGTYTLEVQGGAGVRAGFNAAASGNATFTAGTGTRVLNGEVTQSSLGLFSGSTASFSFTMTAPMTAGMMTLYAAGNSVNDNQSDNGDFAASATMDIMVVQAPVVDAGSGQSDAGSHPDSGTTTTPSHDGGTAGASGAEDDGGSSSSPGAPAVVAYPKGPPPAYLPGAVDGDMGCSAAGGAPLLLIVLALTRRRR